MPKHQTTSSATDISATKGHAGTPRPKPNMRYPRSLWVRILCFPLRLWLLPLQIYLLAIVLSLGIDFGEADGTDLLARLLSLGRILVTDVARVWQLVALMPLVSLVSRYPWTLVAAVVPFALLIWLDSREDHARKNERRARGSRGFARQRPQEWVDTTSPFRILNDRPWSNGAGAFAGRVEDGAAPLPGHDLLGYSDLISVLRQLILASAEYAPFALSFEAEWGMGKTTAMLMLQDALANRLFTAGDREWQCVTVWFNAWKYRGADVQKGLVTAVLDGIDRRSLRWNFSAAGRRRLVTLGVDLAFGLMRLGDLAGQFAEHLDSSAHFRNEFQEEFRRIRDHWRDILRREPLLVVFVDDLDRCGAPQIAHTLETMKLFFDTPGCVFVLGFDSQIVASAIQRDSRGLITDGAAYLKKLIQFKYALPRPNDAELEGFLLGQIRDAGLDVVLKRIKDAVPMILRGTGRNPREIKRFLNAMVVNTQVLADHLNNDGDYGALARLLLLQIRWPTVYNELSRATQGQQLHDLIDDIEAVVGQASDDTAGDATQPDGQPEGSIAS